MLHCNSCWDKIERNDFQFFMPRYRGLKSFLILIESPRSRTCRFCFFTILHPADPFAQRGLGDMKPFRGAAEVQRFSEHDNRPKIVQRKFHNLRLSDSGNCFIGQHEVNAAAFR